MLSDSLNDMAANVRSLLETGPDAQTLPEAETPRDALGANILLWKLLLLERVVIVKHVTSSTLLCLRLLLCKGPVVTLQFVASTKLLPLVVCMHAYTLMLSDAG
jgi:hypothetical protein